MYDLERNYAKKLLKAAQQQVCHNSNQNDCRYAKILQVVDPLTSPEKEELLVELLLQPYSGERAQDNHNQAPHASLPGW